MLHISMHLFCTVWISLFLYYNAIFLCEFLLICVSQDHKYVVQAEMLCKSWHLDETQLDFVHMLQEMKKNEIRGTYYIKTM